MIGVINIGNVIPVFTNLAYQLRNISGCTGCRSGIVTERDSILPFQFPLSTGAVAASWGLRSLDDEATLIPLDIGLIDFIETDNPNIVAKAIYSGGIIPTQECGEYYAEITVDGVPYYTDVFIMQGDACGSYSTSLSLGECFALVSPPPDWQTSLGATDTLGGTFISGTIGIKVDAGAWDDLAVGENGSRVLQWTDGETIQVRRSMTCTCGTTVQTYTLNYTVGDACTGINLS